MIHKLVKASAFTLGLVAASGDRNIWVDSTERVIRDKEDRHVIFHGVNVVYKVAPYIPDEQIYDSQSSLTDADIDNLVSWGFNMVRLGVMWEAVETAPGVYNDTYLAEVDKLITKLGEKGIYTLVDAHQDVLARVVCGEGIPDFYAKEVLQGPEYCFSALEDTLLSPLFKQYGFCKSIKDYDYKVDSNGNPEISECQKESFFIYYTSPEAMSLFRAIYFNEYGMQDNMVNYWEKVANALSPNQYVMGFDPFNEPMPAWTGIV